MVQVKQHIYTLHKERVIEIWGDKSLILMNFSYPLSDHFKGVLYR